MQATLDHAGIRSFDDLLRWDRNALDQKFGAMGGRLWHLARGEDNRRVSPHEPMKSISAETTFFEDTSDRDLLDGHLWRLAERVSDRAKAKARAQELLAEARKAPDQFADLARKFSQDKGSAPNGGDLDFFPTRSVGQPFRGSRFPHEEGGYQCRRRSRFRL